MRRNLLGGFIFHHFGGGGASAPPPPPATVTPPKPDTPDNSAAQAAARKKGLQSTLLTGATAPGLGGSQSLLGASAPASNPFMGQSNAYGGEA